MSGLRGSSSVSTTPLIATLRDTSGNSAFNVGVAGGLATLSTPASTGFLIAPGSGGGLSLGNGADPTKRLTLNLSGSATATATTLTFAQTVNRTLTFPDASTTVVGTDVAQVLTNKTLTSPKVTSGNAPATAAATGTVGQIEWDSGFIYVCTATNTWKRAALATW